MYDVIFWSSILGACNKQDDEKGFNILQWKGLNYFANCVELGSVLFCILDLKLDSGFVGLTRWAFIAF